MFSAYAARHGGGTLISSASQRELAKKYGVDRTTRRSSAQAIWGFLNEVGGTAADVTGIGAIVGVPADVVGVYQVATGGFRAVRSFNQFGNAKSNPEVRKSPLQYFGDVLLGVVPFGGTITDILGGLP